LQSRRPSSLLDPAAYVTALHRPSGLGVPVALIGAAVSAVLFRQEGE
jgi:hypothetical protein